MQANPKHILASFDVSNAFLNAELSEDVLILTQPAPELTICHVKPGTLYQCTKACYGLREALKLWEEARDKTLTSFVFQMPDITAFGEHAHVAAFLIYVDDFLAAGPITATTHQTH